MGEHDAAIRRVAALQTAIADVEAGRRTTPIIGEQTATGEFRVTFLAKSTDATVPRVASDVTGWGENVTNDTFDFTIGRMARVGSGDWYSLDTLVAPGARIEYFLVHGRDYELDRWNPRKTRIRGGGAASEFVTPGYAPPEAPAPSSSVPAGIVVHTTIRSRALGSARRVIVYTPPAYRRDRSYPVAVFQQGVRAVTNNGPANDAGAQVPPAIEPAVSPSLLDDLIDRRAIEPVIIVFVESYRFGDSRGYSRAAMHTFLGGEVPSWVAAHFTVSPKASRRAILGVSAGAREAVEAALASPAAFGRLGLLLPARRVALEPNVEEAIGHQAHALHVAILTGRYDHANLATARRLRQAFTDAGDSVDFIEVPEGHTQSTWHDHMSKVLVALFGPPAGVTASAPWP